jgi:hypothetical protein
MTDPMPTEAPSIWADETLLRATLARSGTPEAVALALLGAAIKLERTTKPSVPYLLNMYVECLDAVYGDRRRPREPKDTSDDTRDKLGTALSEIGSIIEVLQSMDDCANGVNEQTLGYLTERLRKSRKQALDAFGRIPHDHHGGAA